MTDKYTIIKESFDTTSGVTTVEISTVLGNFVGTTTIDDIDAQYPSLYHANEIAMAKALRKFAKAAIRTLKMEVKMLKCMVTETFGHGPVDTKSHPVKVLLSTLKTKEKELALWMPRYEAMSASITNRIAARDKIVKGYMDKVNKAN